jgi:hypothetical protein
MAGTPDEIETLKILRARLASGEWTPDAATLQKFEARYNSYIESGDIKPRMKVSENGVPFVPLTDSQRTRLENNVAQFQLGNSLRSGFKPDFAGAPLGLGVAENRLQGAFSAIGTPGQADWWRRFNEQDTSERFKIFGASLTASEKQAWADTTVAPGTAPDQVANKIAAREAITKAGMARYINGLIAANVNPDEIAAMVGGQEQLSSILAPTTHTTQIGDKQFTFATPADATPEQIQRSGAQEAQKLGFKVTPEDFRTNYNMVQENRATPGTDAAARDTFGGEVDAAVRGVADSLTIGADNKIVAGLNTFLPLDRLSGRDVKSVWDGMSVGDAYQANLALENRIDAIDEQVNPLARLGGQVAGGVLGLGKLNAAAVGGTTGRAALARTAAADAGAGFVYGANTASDTTNDANEIIVQGLKTGATTAAGGQIGNLAGQIVGKGLTGAKNATAEFLQSKGITLTPGQILGGTVQRVEDALTSRPVVGDIINARRSDSVEDFNRAVMSDALAPIGVGGPKDIGEKGVLYLQEKVGESFTKALGGVKLSVDDVYKTEMGQVLKAAQDLPGDLREQFVATMTNRVDRLFKRNKDGSITLNGDNFQDALQGIRKDVSALYKNGSVQADVFDGVASQAEDVLINLAKRQSPGTAEALDAANAAYRNKSVVQKAVLTGQNTGGVFTPAQLGRASTANAIKFGGENAAAAGNRPFFDLQRAAQDTLPSTVNDSGTFTRAAVGGMFGLGVPGLAAYGANEGLIDPTTAVGIGVLSAPFTRTGSKAMNAALTKRPQAVADAGEIVLKSSAPQSIGATAGALYMGGPRDPQVTVDPRTGVLYDAQGRIVGVNRSN